MGVHKIPPPDCYEVYNWPEFRAFAARLGIPLDFFTRRVQIDLPGEGQSVVITHEYLGEDRQAADKPQVRDTTSMANETHRTYQPVPKRE